MLWWLFLIPLSSAFSCWLIIKLFFAILFRPYTQTSVLGFAVQGILPAKQKSLAAETGKMVAKSFFSAKEIEEKIADPSGLQNIIPIVEEHVDDFLRIRLKKEMPFIGVFIGEKTIQSLKQVFIKELETLFPNIMKTYAGNLINDLNIEQRVTQKIMAVSIGNVELVARKKFSKELRRAELISSLIGLLIGFIFMLFIYLFAK